MVFYISVQTQDKRMINTYAMVEIQDALTKISLYLNSLLANSNNPERCEKAVNLATETFLKFMQYEQFAKESYDKVRALIMSKNNYYALLIIDQMMKNNKYAYRAGKQNCENLFKGVWERTWLENKESPKVENLKLMVKVWGYIYGAKVEENLKKWVQYTFKTKFSISPEKEAELKDIYGVPQPVKIDDFLLKTVRDENDEKDQKDEKDVNLLQALMDSS